MGSPDSGRFSGQRSSFSHTCALFSQYLKQNGSFSAAAAADLTLGTPGTMNLIPLIQKSAPNSNLIPLNLFPAKRIDPSAGEANGERVVKEMKILYDGQVMVFKDFPAEKAKEIIALAMNTQTPNISPCTDDAGPVSGFQNQAPYSHLPIARRTSLARFLEKRKNRITSKAPYQKENSVGTYSKQEENKAWLGLAAQFPVKN